jgi:hypothetical protein
MNAQDSNMAANAVCHSASMVQESIQQAAYELMRPAVIFKPKLSRDGNKWCALFGDDLQSGVAGFGDSPADAMWDFDREWTAKITGEAQG